jgi:hypothetical protein
MDEPVVTRTVTTTRQASVRIARTAKAAAVKATVAATTIAAVTIVVKNAGAAAKSVGDAIRNVAAQVVVKNAAGGTVPQTQWLRGLAMKKPNDDGSWTHNVADVDQKTIVDPTSGFAKTSTTGWARIIISTRLKWW